jgi:hypothetical protein
MFKKVPVGPNFWMRPLPVSATQMLPPEVAAMPCGALSWPLALPVTPA